jgi:hypothetical protein
LIVWVSGDGGYNEVINGVMDAGATPFARLWPEATPTTTAAAPASNR